MNFSFNYFGLLILLFSVGFSTCVDPNDISLYDPEEFDVNDLLNDPMVIDALQSSESNHEEEPSLRKPLNKEITPAKKPKHKSRATRRLISIECAFKRNKEISTNFRGLLPAKVNPNNLTLGELEMKFYEQGIRHPWRELQEYPLKDYPKYWAHVCDYFWVKENPEDPRSRACHIKHSLLFDDTSAVIYYKVRHLKFTRAEVLCCSCHYYDRKRTEPVSPSVVFAVHKHSDSEYFNLTKVRRETKKVYRISNFWTGITLPIPDN